MLKQAISIFFLTACWPIILKASIIPCSEVLSTELEIARVELVKAESIGDPIALLYAKELVTKSKTATATVSAWALNTYVSLLLENDSISKAQELLIDSTLINWNEADGWLQDYHSLNLGLTLAFNGKYAESDKLFRTILSHNPDGILTIHASQALADNLRYQGKYDQSLIRWYEALKQSEGISDSSEIADAYLGRGTVKFLQDELDKAENDIQTFYKYYLRIGNQKKIAYGLSLIGLLEYQRGRFELSIERNLEGYNIRKKIGDLKGQGESLNNLALGYMGLKNWGQALSYLQEALQLKTRANDLTQMTVILNNMGHCHNRLNDSVKALKCFTLALTIAKENGQMNDAIRSYKNIISIYTVNKDYQNALEKQTTLLALKDSLAAAERTEAINELEVKYETEKKEQEITLLQQDRAIINNRWLTLALGLFLAIIIGVLFIDNQKRKHKQEKQLLLTEDELQKSELKNMSDLLEFNQNKLSLHTENLLKKNELVGQLESRLKETVKSSSQETEQGKQLIEDFSAVRILTDDDWTEFKALFNGVHAGLLDNLLNNYNNLTLGEQRLFLLMKLELSTKEIANILGVSPESVKKGRYRLKKKIGVEEETSLQEFVTSF